jgi:hypothetical protein
MTNEVVPPGSALQEEQQALLARVYDEPTTASVLRALEGLYSQFPAAMAYPTLTTTFGTGTNSNS